MKKDKGLMFFRFNRRALATALAAFTIALVAPLAARAADDEVTLTILHDNDLHGHILPFAYTETGRSPDEMPSVGGAARRATLVRQLRAAARNPTILIDSGDTFTRGAFTNAWEGLADVAAMNAVGYDLASLGNNEFKAKDASEASDAAGAQAALLRLIKASNFPWVCANATDSSGKFLTGVQPFVIRRFGPVRVGFLGLTAPRVDTYPQAKGWHVADAVTTANNFIPIARAQCDILIAVTHIGADLDKQLAAQTSGLDAIVGGDSHTFLYSAIEVKSADGARTVPIVQDGEFGVNLGKFDLRLMRNVDGTWRLAGYRYGLIPVGPDIPEAADVKAAIAPYFAPLAVVIGWLPSESIGKTPKERVRLSTQVWMDAFRRQTDADIAITPNGDGFFEVFRSRAVRRYDVFAAEPFKDHVVIASLTGAQLQTLLAGHFDNVVSGDTSALDVNRVYKVAMIDNIARTEYKLPEGALQDTGRDMRDLLIEDMAAGRK